jgi:hypothetical protein
MIPSMSSHSEALQLLFIELRVGLARSAIQAGMVLNGIAAMAALAFLATTIGAPVGGPLRLDPVLLKVAIGIFGFGVFLAGITFVNAYVAQGAIASGKTGAVGNGLRRLGLALIIASLLLFLLGLALTLNAILIV